MFVSRLVSRSCTSLRVVSWPGRSQSRPSAWRLDGVTFYSSSSAKLMGAGDDSFVLRGWSEPRSGGCFAKGAYQALCETDLPIVREHVVEVSKQNSSNMAQAAMLLLTKEEGDESSWMVDRELPSVTGWLGQLPAPFCLGMSQLTQAHLLPEGTLSFWVPDSRPNKRRKNERRKSIWCLYEVFCTSISCAS